MFEVLVIFLLLLPLYLLRQLRRKHDETSIRFTKQMHAIFDTLNQQRMLLGQVLKSGAASQSGVAGEASPVESSMEAPIPPVTALNQNPTLGEFARSSHVTQAARPKGVVQIPPVQASTELQASMRHAATPRPAERTPPVPRVPNRFEVAAKDVLQRIWNWIIVGEENIPEGVSVEFAIASQWLLRIGIMLLVIGIGFFLKLSIERGFISPTARVALSVAAGLVMLIAGTRILGGKYHVMGQGLLGGGIATLYFSAFAAANFYHLIEMPVAFAAMIAVTALSGFIAVRFHSILTAVLGVIGGYGTPVMLATGQVNFPGLYGYMLVLGLGVLGICAWKRWPLLNYLSFTGNFFLVGGSLRDYQPGLHFWQVMPFLIAFFVLFSRWSLCTTCVTARSQICWMCWCCS